MASEYREEHSKPTPAGSYNETNKIENRALQPASTNGYTIEENEGVNGLEDSDADADGEDVDNLETNSTAVRIESGNNILRDDKATQSDANEMLSQRKKGHSSDRHSNSSVSESEADQEWEGKSESSADGGDEIVNGNRCISFCGQDEENDPSEEFEEYLACAVCGDNSHRQCARDSQALTPEGDGLNWRCPTCTENGLGLTSMPESPETIARRTSAPMVARDLLPGHRGSSKPDSHSVFNTLILDDDPMDGSRSLRKRKTPSDEAEQSTGRDLKRQRSDEDVEELSETGSPILGGLLREAKVKTRSLKRKRSQNTEGHISKVIQRTKHSIIISFRLDRSRLGKILSIRPRRRLNRESPSRNDTRAAGVISFPLTDSFNYLNHFPALHSLEAREDNSKPYGGILNEADADTSKTCPQTIDRKRFEDARHKAEEEWRLKTEEANNSAQMHYNQKTSGSPSMIKCINFGGYEIDTWHAAPYPEEYSRNRVLYICEFCLKYLGSKYVAWRHKLKCAAKHPPGDEIYRDGKFSFFEVDGRKNPVYCQNLCLLAKLFLGSKTLYYDVEPFLFYIMTENDEYGCHFVGYFSKEKRPSSPNNVSCILVLPIHQRRGFGHYLIDFSYLLTRVEKKTGSPEKPLSDMGLVSYRSYWRLVLCQLLVGAKDAMSIADLSDQTGMTADDIVSALEGLRALARDPDSGAYAYRLDFDYFTEYINNYASKGYCKIKTDALVWTPYVMGRGHANLGDDGPPLHVVAPREEPDDDETAEEGVQAEQGNHASAHANGLASQDDDHRDGLPHATHFPAPVALDAVLGATASSSDTASAALSANATAPDPAASFGSSKETSDDDAEAEAEAAIPAWRYQVWPPTPGRVPRRRPGRPYGSRNKRTVTPVRRTGSLLRQESPVSVSRLLTGRRTRSRLGEVVSIHNDEHESDEDGELDEVLSKANGNGDVSHLDDPAEDG